VTKTVVADLSERKRSAITTMREKEREKVVLCDSSRNQKNKKEVVLCQGERGEILPKKRKAKCRVRSGRRRGASVVAGKGELLSRYLTEGTVEEEGKKNGRTPPHREKNTV